MLSAIESRRRRNRGLLLLVIPPIGMLALWGTLLIINDMVARNSELPDQGAMALLGLIVVFCGLIAFVAMLMGIVIFIRSYR